MVTMMISQDLISVFPVLQFRFRENRNRIIFNLLKTSWYFQNRKISVFHWFQKLLGCFLFTFCFFPILLKKNFHFVLEYSCLILPIIFILSFWSHQKTYIGPTFFYFRTLFCLLHFQLIWIAFQVISSVTASISLSFIYFLKILFNWKLITLQYCSGFCYTLTWLWWLYF